MKLMNHKEKRSYQTIDSETFVTTWMKRNSIQEVAEDLELTKQQVTSKATTLRNRGVNLPKKSHGLSEVDRLNKIIERMKKP